MSTKYFRTCCLLFSFLLFIAEGLHAQNDSAAMAKADTSNFSRNAVEGWQLYNSYVAANEDSVRLELILQHTNNVIWTTEQKVGKIKNNTLKPGQQRILTFALSGVNYQLRINTSGDCYVKVLSGGLPVGSTVVLPFIVEFKK